MPGCNNVAVANPVIWDDITNLRFQSTNFDANRDTFGYIVAPAGRQVFEQTAKFAGGGVSIWDTVGTETQVTLEVADGRLFAGIWNYLVIGVWGPQNEEDFGVDLVVDPYSLAVNSEIVLTVSLYCR
jgi:hypothetical protein